MIEVTFFVGSEGIMNLWNMMIRLTVNTENRFRCIIVFLCLDVLGTMVNAASRKWSKEMIVQQVVQLMADDCASKSAFDRTEWMI